MKRGLLLFAHGARDPQWALPFEAVARRVLERNPAQPVELAFLEFMSPNLHEAGLRLASAGCSDIDVLPLFLGAGGHVRKDLPALLAALSAACPGVRWHLRRAIGEFDEIIEAMAAAAAALPDADRPSTG